jgi:hypothetical protein
MESRMKDSDDQKYSQLMARYKELRGELGPQALPYLQAAMKLRANGNVSEDAVVGAAYL